LCALSPSRDEKHRKKTTTKTGMRTRHSDEEKGDDVFHHQMFF